MSDPAQATAELNAQLQRDFPSFEPVIGNVVRRPFGESHIALGLLSLTRSRRTLSETLPDTYTQVQTAAVYSSDTLRFPGFDLLPENFAYGLVEKAAQIVLRVGNTGKVEFPSHPEFSSQYRVQAFDAEGVRWLFDDRVLAQLASRPGLSVSAANGNILLYRAEEEVSADGMEAFFEEAAEVFRVFEAAARRPSALQNTMRAPETDAELLVKLAPAGSLKLLHAVTFADADTFVRQSPPRTISPAIARYVEERVPDMVIAIAVLLAMTSTAFLAVEGTKMPWYGQIPLGLVLAGGAGLLLWACVARLRIRHLLKHGLTGMARLEAIQTIDSRIDGQERHRLEFQVEAGGTVHKTSCYVHWTMVDPLKANVTDKRRVPVLYSAANPRYALVAEALVMAMAIA